MGDIFGKSSPPPPPPPPPPSPFLETPLRAFNWGANKDLRKYVTNYKPQAGASHVRILLYGPVGAGKSSFINSAFGAIAGRDVNVAEADISHTISSFTEKYRTHEYRIEGKKVPIVFSDIMGLNNESDFSILPEDIVLAMKGHVKDKYQFNGKKGLSKEDDHYNQNPSIDDKVHVLALVLNGNTEVQPNVLKKIKEIRKTARDLGIPQVMILTHIDHISKEIVKDLRTVFRSIDWKNRIDHISKRVGILPKYTFPVWNNYEEEDKDAANALILDALEKSVLFGADFIDAYGNNS